MIYMLEDDANIRNFVLYALNNTGLEAKGFERPSEFWEALREEKPTMLLLDIMLPEEDGLSVLSKIRANPEYSGLPVIMLTAKGSEYDKVIGLDSGARRLPRKALRHDGTHLQDQSAPAPHQHRCDN